ncbi:pseudouridine synthase [Streptomyces uncialis]|uniref:RNA pseudouridylate synthase n=1 Tax=Streptomyces uncialis TaxID=1048205 RepID=A0A1Q4V466_9ACTN|nr:pseudouridine synthase [Streptomyces uncialis]OKH92628.1 pseudouridylate synthase [Streptomyces uncialis]
MSRRRRTPPPPAPLPQRDGIDPVRLRLPAAGPDTANWPTVRDHLVDRLAPSADTIDALLGAGAFVTADGTPVTPLTPYVPGLYVWFHRPRTPETPVPFPLPVVYRDEHIVVVDKPHFLATTPRGGHITETALARLRRDLDLPALGAAHRLDRLTAGLVLFTVRPEERGAYQTLFRDKRIHKEYEGLAPYRDDLELPRTVRSRIEKERGVLTAREVPGEPNAETRVELIGNAGPDSAARYRLLPRTGRTHQLRVHMNSLGIPLIGDPLYPVVLDPVADGDFREPLRLLARVLGFTDPVTGLRHRFVSARRLDGAPARPPEPPAR